MRAKRPPPDLASLPARLLRPVPLVEDWLDPHSDDPIVMRHEGGWFDMVPSEVLSAWLAERYECLSRLGYDRADFDEVLPSPSHKYRDERVSIDSLVQYEDRQAFWAVLAARLDL